MGDVDFLDVPFRDLPPNGIATLNVDNKWADIPLGVLGLPAEAKTNLSELEVSRVTDDRAVLHLVTSITKGPGDKSFAE